MMYMFCFSHLRFIFIIFIIAFKINLVDIDCIGFFFSFSGLVHWIEFWSQIFMWRGLIHFNFFYFLDVMSDADIWYISSGRALFIFSSGIPQGQDCVHNKRIKGWKYFQLNSARCFLNEAVPSPFFLRINQFMGIFWPLIRCSHPAKLLCYLLFLQPIFFQSTLRFILTVAQIGFAFLDGHIFPIMSLINPNSFQNKIGVNWNYMSNFFFNQGWLLATTSQRDSTQN